jgi:plasmid stabilization system protein ParE
MTEQQFRPQAVDDLLDIWSFIARNNHEAADRVEAAIMRSCELLSDGLLEGVQNAT